MTCSTTRSGVEAPEVIPTVMGPLGRNNSSTVSSSPRGLCSIELSEWIRSGVSMWKERIPRVTAISCRWVGSLQGNQLEWCRDRLGERLSQRHQVAGIGSPSMKKNQACPSLRCGLAEQIGGHGIRWAVAA